MELGEMIKEKREKLKWSQLRLGDESNVDAAQIGKYERGKIEPKVATLRNIADALGVECGELLDDMPRKRKMPPEVREKCEELLKLFHELMCMTYEDY